jgi:hypothetical protein
VRIYFDPRVFIDYLSISGTTNALSNGRRGRAPGDIADDAQHLLEIVSRAHTAATSCFTYYEVEEALYRMLAHSAEGVSRTDELLIPAARAITTQIQIVIDLFNISVLDLTPETVRLHLRQLDLQTRGVRAADALHVATAIVFNADLLVSADEAISDLDGTLVNAGGRKMICADTDRALEILKHPTG